MVEINLKLKNADYEIIDFTLYNNNFLSNSLQMFLVKKLDVGKSDSLQLPDKLLSVSILLACFALSYTYI